MQRTGRLCLPVLIAVLFALPVLLQARVRKFPCSTSSLLATMTVEEATDTDVFVAFLEQVLCPKPQTGRPHPVALIRSFPRVLQEDT